jgi:hypothetical protein
MLTHNLLFVIYKEIVFSRVTEKCSKASVIWRPLHSRAVISEKKVHLILGLYGNINEQQFMNSIRNNERDRTTGYAAPWMTTAARRKPKYWMYDTSPSQNTTLRPTDKKWQNGEQSKFWNDRKLWSISKLSRKRRKKGNDTLRWDVDTFMQH